MKVALQSGHLKINLNWLNINLYYCISGALYKNLYLSGYGPDSQVSH